MEYLATSLFFSTKHFIEIPRVTVNGVVIYRWSMYLRFLAILSVTGNDTRFGHSYYGIQIGYRSVYNLLNGALLTLGRLYRHFTYYKLLWHQYAGKYGLAYIM